MRISKRVYNNALYLIDGFNVTGVTKYTPDHKSARSHKAARKIAREMIYQGASHVNIAKVIEHIFPK